MILIVRKFVSSKIKVLYHSEALVSKDFSKRLVSNYKSSVCISVLQQIYSLKNAPVCHIFGAEIKCIKFVAVPCDCFYEETKSNNNIN